LDGGNIMNINYTAKRTVITPEIEKVCERRLKSIEKLLGYPVETHCKLSVEKYRQIAEITIKIKGGTLNADEETSDMHSSLTMAFDRIEKRVKKERQKLRERKRRGNKIMEAPSVSEDEEEGKRVVRIHEYSPKPMSVEEALIHLESTKKEILVFRKSDSDRWAVLYERKDGNIGLIEPE